MLHLPLISGITRIIGSIVKLDLEMQTHEINHISWLGMYELLQVNPVMAIFILSHSIKNFAYEWCPDSLVYVISTQNTLQQMVAITEAI